MARVRRARAPFYEIAREGARARASHVTWDCEHAKTPDGYYQVRGGIDYAIAKSLAAAPYADVLWMETKTADLHDAKIFADAIHAAFPDKMLAYNLSPSFNWDTTGHDRRADAALPRGAREARASSSTSSPTAATRSTASRARSSRPRSARTACSRSRGCSGSSASSSRATARRRRSSAARAPTPRSCRISGRTSTTKAMGKGSTQFQHLVQTEVPPKLLEEWLDALAQAPRRPGQAHGRR